MAKESVLERIFDLQIRAHGLPEPEREVYFARPRLWRIDRAWPMHGHVAAELQGGTWSQGRHSRGKGYENDYRKANAAVDRGWRLYHFTGDMVRSGEAVEIIKAALAAEGQR